MHPLLRWGVFGLAIAGAFAGGYFVKNSLLKASPAAEPGPDAVASAPAQAQKAASLRTVIARSTATRTHTAPDRPVTMRVTATETHRGPEVATKAGPPTILLPPVAVGEKQAPEPVDPNDPALRMIRDAMNIKTTILDKPAPPPVVLADGKRDQDPFIPPPTPMTGPPPKLEIPPSDVGAQGGPPVVIPERPRSIPLLNSRAVELDFEVTKAGLSKIKAAELWTTRDGGTSWKQTDRMEGARPPFRTRLGSEGVYGFRLVFESEAGMRTPEPKPGQSPDLVLVLDTTPPEIEIYPPLSGREGTILLRWKVADRHPDRDPGATRLEYSPDGQTWQAIDRAGSTDMSSFEWALPPGVPAKVLLRVTARDQAGNVAVAVTNEKMSVDLVAPEGKLTGVRVQGQGPEAGPMPHEAEAGAAGGGPIPAVLESVLPALLNSPLWFTPITAPAAEPVQVPRLGRVTEDDTRQPSASADPGDFAGQPSASGYILPKDWAPGLTKANMTTERPVWAPQRRDPFAMAVVGPDLRPVCEPGLWNENGVGGLLADCWYRYHRPLVPIWGRMTEEEFQAFVAEFPATSPLAVLADRDWQPSTARPESYRWDGPTFADRPFGGAFDVVPGLWGTAPGGGVRLDF